MGEKKSRTARLIAKHPTCTYCGGIENSTSRDHCPPIAMFDSAHRPQGLEFGACTECHNGTRAIDQFITMFSRMNPSNPSDDQRDELAKQARSFISRYPDLAAKILKRGEPILYGGQKRYLVVMDRDEKIDRMFASFAARVCLALYRERCGVPAPANAKIATTWMTNFDLDRSDAIDNFLTLAGTTRSLHQGEWHVADQFRYWFAEVADDPTAFLCFAAFRETFGFFAWIGERDTFSCDGFEVLKPGFLKGLSVA